MSQDNDVDYRQKCIEQKGEFCVICGKDDDVVVHHLDGDRSNHDIENLLPLCIEHHGRVHGNDDALRGFVEMLPKDSMSGADRLFSQFEILDTFTRVGRPFISTTDVVEKLDMTRQPARNRLAELVEHGFLHEDKVGNIPTYWLSNKGISLVYNPGELKLETNYRIESRVPKSR